VRDVGILCEVFWDLLHFQGILIIWRCDTCCLLEGRRKTFCKGWY
jgi:hypothetical protein